MLQRILFSLLFGLLIIGGTGARGAECNVPDSVSELLTGDTYFSNCPVLRNSDGAFTVSNNLFRELSTYLNTLNLPPVAQRAYVILRKPLTLYDPLHTLHYGKPWYNHRGDVVNPAGDGDRLKNDFENNIRAVQVDMLDFQLKHGWGPFVLYEVEDKGRDVVDVEVVLLDKNDCWLNKLDISCYRLPLLGNVNLDNVDGGNEYLNVVLAPSNGNGYYSLIGGTGSLHPERAESLRQEWDTRSVGGASLVSGNNYSKPTVAGTNIDQVMVAVLPHLREPEIILADQGGTVYLFVALPKYFHDGLIATYVSLECVGDQANVRMVRGKIQRVFPTMISRKVVDNVLHSK